MVDEADELPDDIDQAKTLLYARPMETFVAERDALVRRLRGAGRQDDAKVVKALRKASRPAWTLDAGFHADPDAVERLAAAVNEVIEAQAGRGDMRDATRSLRDAVQAVATNAAGAAKAAGVNVDRASLGPALLAVVADPVAFAELRQGQLAEVPTAGALDVLTNPPPLLPVSPSAVAALVASRRTEEEPEESTPVPAPVDLAARRRAREAVEVAETAASEARREADDADRAVADARAALDTAEQAFRQAETDVKAARNVIHDAQQTAKSARTAARQADRDLAAARKTHPVA